VTGLVYFPVVVAVDATHVYWATAQGDIWRALLDGTSPLRIASLGAGWNITDLAVDDRNVYFPNCVYPTGSINRVAK